MAGWASGSHRPAHLHGPMLGHAFGQPGVSSVTHWIPPRGSGGSRLRRGTTCTWASTSVCPVARPSLETGGTRWTDGAPAKFRIVMAGFAEAITLANRDPGPPNLRSPFPRLPTYEAGHAVAHRSQGLRFRRAAIIPDEKEGTLGHVAHGYPKWFNPESGDTTRHRLMAEKHIIAALARDIAESKFLGRRVRAGFWRDYGNASRKGFCGMPTWWLRSTRPWVQ